MKTDRRNFKNTLVDHAGQLRFAVPFAALLGLHFAALLVINVYLSRELSQIDPNSPREMVLAASISSAFVFSAALGSIVFTFTAFTLWLIYSHRVFGPLVPFRRHLRSLLAGDYSRRTTLRRRDEFKELARGLNELAEALERDGKKA